MVSSPDGVGRAGDCRRSGLGNRTKPASRWPHSQSPSAAQHRHRRRARPSPSVGAVERCVVREDPAVGGHQPVALGCIVRGHADDGAVQRDAPGRTGEGSVAVVEDATVGGHEASSPLPLGVTVMPLTGWLRVRLPVEPKNGASKAKIPPSEATSQYPPVSGSAARPTIGLVEVLTAHRTMERRVAEGEDPAVGRHQPVAPCRRASAPCRRPERSGTDRPSIRRIRRRRRRRCRRRPPPASSPGRRVWRRCGRWVS